MTEKYCYCGNRHPKNYKHGEHHKDIHIDGIYKCRTCKKALGNEELRGHINLGHRVIGIWDGLAWNR